MYESENLLHQNILSISFHFPTNFWSIMALFRTQATEKAAESRSQKNKRVHCVSWLHPKWPSRIGGEQGSWTLSPHKVPQQRYKRNLMSFWSRPPPMSTCVSPVPGAMQPEHEANSKRVRLRMEVLPAGPYHPQIVSWWLFITYCHALLCPWFRQSKLLLTTWACLESVPYRLDAIRLMWGSRVLVHTEIHWGIKHASWPGAVCQHHSQRCVNSKRIASSLPPVYSLIIWVMSRSSMKKISDLRFGGI